MRKINRFYSLPLLLAIGMVLLLQYYYFDNFNWTFFGLMLLPILVVSIGDYWLTQKRLRKIKTQLYEILKTLEAFDIDEPQKVIFKDSPFPIFNELNDYLIELVDRVRTHYQANKQFTENASHELQTPLAVIKGQVEMLIQSQKIGEQEMEALAIILQNTNRLSKINSALILLSKIEHQRFSDLETVDFQKIIKEISQNFQDLIKIQEIEIHQKITHPFKIEMSATLAEVLVANLIQNAIRHNTGTFIDIEMDANGFSVANYGDPPKVPPQKLFTRFKRVSDKEESLGLGLAIVQRICEQSELEVQYKFDKTERHILQIKKE